MSARFFALAFLICCACTLPAGATNYYVSPSGNDLFTGTSSYLPWASVARVNTASLSSGDHVYFQRGGTWRETLTVQTSGLYFGAYGTGNRPVISGANLLGGLFSLWLPAGSNLWTAYLGTAPTQLWFNSVLGTQVSSLAAVQTPQQWFYSQGFVYVYSSQYPLLKYTAPGIEATQRAQALVVKGVSSLTAEHIAFVNAGDTAVSLAADNSGVETFNDVVVSGAHNAGLSVASGYASLNASKVLNSGMGVNVTGGLGFALVNSLVTGNSNQAVVVNGTTGASTISSSTLTGNATATPDVETVTNSSGYPLYVNSSVLLPNPYEPKVYNYSNLTDAGNNAYQSPYLGSRAAPLVVVPFIDDYINLGVAQAVSQLAISSGCKMSYALNTKLMTPQAWAQIAQMQAAGVDIVAHTRSHSDLANNNVFTIQYTGTAAKATMTINQTTNKLLTYLNGSTTPDLNLDLSNTYNGVIDVLGLIPAGSPYKVVIQTNQNYFTPINLASVASTDIKTAPYMAQAGAGYLTWEVEGAQADIAANLPGYKAKAFATPFTSSNVGVENHIRDAGFASNRNGLLNGDLSPDGNWLNGTTTDVYNMGAEWLPFAYDATQQASSAGALVEGLGAAGGVMAVYSHGYDEFSLQNWADFFSQIKQLGATCMTMSQANAYIESQGQLIPDGTAKNWIATVPLNANYATTNSSPTQGAHGLQP